MEKPITYQTWRETKNPWTNNFYGNLDPVTDKVLIDSIHQMIDDYFNPRCIGVYDSDRFMVLFKKKLNEVEYRFYQSLTFDKEYIDILRAYQDIEMESVTDTTSTLDGERDNTTTTDLTNTSNTTVNPFTTTVTESYDNYKELFNSNDTTNIDSTVTDKNTGTINNTIENNGQTRELHSDMPQSNVSDSTLGLGVDVKWNYASDLKDNLNKSTETNNTENNLTTTSTTDSSNVNTNESTASKEGSIISETSNGEQGSNSTSKNTGTVTNTETTNNTTKDNTKTNNSGRNTNIADILDRWKNYLYKRVSAFEWLFSELEVLFYAVFDDD